MANQRIVNPFTGDTLNAFCPTGKGRGIKNTCGREGGGSGGGLSAGDKVSISGGIFKGKKATVVGITTEGVEVQFPSTKLHGQVRPGGKHIIPHELPPDKPTMTTVGHLQVVGSKGKSKGSKDSAGGSAKAYKEIVKADKKYGVGSPQSKAAREAYQKSKAG